MGKRHGLTLIELLVILTIISIFILVDISAWKKQMMRGRAAKRKADLDKMQTVLEDYLNDESFYPEILECNQDFSPYLTQVLCDPLNTTYFNYFYSTSRLLRSWYKIFTRLESDDDPIIKEIGCEGGCGPSNNYNYWVSSSNVTQVARLPDEVPWPTISPPPGASPTPEGPTSTPTLGPTPTPSPTPTSGPTPIPSPIPTPDLSNLYGCFSGVCEPLSFWCVPNFSSSNCAGSCGTPQNPINQCQ